MVILFRSVCHLYLSLRNHVPKIKLSADVKRADRERERAITSPPPIRMRDERFLWRSSLEKCLRQPPYHQTEEKTA